jgi:hypothetical protein
MSVDVLARRQRDRAAIQCPCRGCKRLLDIQDLCVVHFAAGPKELLFHCDACGSDTAIWVD